MFNPTPQNLLDFEKRYNMLLPMKFQGKSYQSFWTDFWGQIRGALEMRELISRNIL